MVAVKSEGDERGIEDMEGIQSTGAPKTNGHKLKKERPSASATPNGSDRKSRTSSVSPEDVKTGGSDSASTPSDQGPPPPKLARNKSSQRNLSRSAPMLFDHLPDATEESCKTFQVINDCLYGSKHMGSSHAEALECDCAEEWRDGQNHACGEDSSCINRLTKLECVDRDCNCGDGCQNQRFQRKQYASVSVIKTEKKGYGLRSNAALQANDFIFEYIGEVINEPTFRRRMLQYDDEGIKHFYFMSLAKNEFVDATKKGNLGRFCNHSCNPNCYVDKWVVGDKLRMGIFALRRIQAGEELVFNYNVDRYGADPQPCYCGEPNCTGYIGGKTQTERATKLPQATIEALGIDDGDSWDTAVAKRPRKKKTTEDDEDYVNSVQPRGLDEEGVTKVMAALMQCKEKWIGVKLLSRIQNADDDRVRHQVVRMHGYQILKTTLNTFMDDTNVVLQILDILYQLPRLTKNKISDAKIEGPIESLAASEHEDVSSESKRLLDEWSKLETAYRIPRKKTDSGAAPTANVHSFDERRNMGREEETSKPDPFANIVIPKGPRSNIPQRANNFFPGAVPGQRPRKQPPTNLPAGWFVATDKSGAYYFYNKKGETTWWRPMVPAEDVGTKSKVQENQKALQDIIDSLTKEPTPRPSANQTPQRVGTPAGDAKKEKWRSLSREKQMKVYENTLFPSVQYVMNKYQQKLPREELKRLAKEVTKKLVASDYKRDRVDDPTAITSHRARQVKEYVKGYFDKAVKYFKERRDHEKRRAEREARHAAASATGSKQEQHQAKAEAEVAREAEADKMDDEVVLTDVEEDAASPTSSTSDRKRKRAGDDEAESAGQTPSETPSVKRVKEDDADAPSPPPPPPPPPEATADVPMTEEERSMREQEEALMRENEEAEEEAQRLADQAAERDKHREEEAALERENEEAMRDFERSRQSRHGDVALHLNGAGRDAMDLDGQQQGEEVGGGGGGGSMTEAQARKREVLSH